MEVAKIEEASKKVGGYYKLSILVQQRVKELVSGSAPLVELKSNDPVEIALEEIIQGKVQLEIK